MSKYLELAHIRSFEILCQYRIAFFNIPWWQINSVRGHFFDDCILLILICREYSVSLATCSNSAYPFLRVVDCFIAISLRELKSVHSVSLSRSKPANLRRCSSHANSCRVTLVPIVWILSHASTKWYHTTLLLLWYRVHIWVISFIPCVLSSFDVVQPSVLFDSWLSWCLI